MHEAADAVMVMAYGSPRDDAGVEPYYTHIRGGRPPSPEQLEDLRARYRAIGGSPLQEITERQASALSRATGMPVYAGMKHSPPFIADVAARARADGVERLIGLPLAPHYASGSLGAYRAELERSWGSGSLAFVPGFHDQPEFLAAVRRLLTEALEGFDPEVVYFTAHSLPVRPEVSGGYRERLEESARLVAQGMPELPLWRIAWQSASSTGESWLGPDLLEELERNRERRVLVCPIGFVADHLEILYDIDVEAQAFAKPRGIELRRTASFNDRPEFIAALAAVVDRTLSAV